MKKSIMTGLLICSNWSILLIILMLVSVLTDFITGRVTIDRQTGIRFICLYIILFLLTFSFLIMLRNMGLNKINTIIKVQLILLFVLYLGMVLFL